MSLDPQDLKTTDGAPDKTDPPSVDTDTRATWVPPAITHVLPITHTAGALQVGVMDQGVGYS